MNTFAHLHQQRMGKVYIFPNVPVTYRLLRIVSGSNLIFLDKTDLLSQVQAVLDKTSQDPPDYEMDLTFHYNEQ